MNRIQRFLILLFTGLGCAAITLVVSTQAKLNEDPIAKAVAGVAGGQCILRSVMTRYGDFMLNPHASGKDQYAWNDHAPEGIPAYKGEELAAKRGFFTEAREQEFVRSNLCPDKTQALIVTAVDREIGAFRKDPETELIKPVGQKTTAFWACYGSCLPNAQ